MIKCLSILPCKGHTVSARSSQNSVMSSSFWMSTFSFKSRSCVVMLPSLRKVVKYQSSSGNYTQDHRAVFLWQPMASLCIYRRRSMVARQFCGCLTICKTVVDLTCERLARFWTFFDRTPYGMYVCCTIILNFHDTSICDFVSNFHRRQEIVRQKNRTWDENKT